MESARTPAPPGAASVGSYALVRELTAHAVPTFVARKGDGETKFVVERLSRTMPTAALAREAAHIARLHHPNLSRAREVVREVIGLSIVSDFVEGEMLAELEQMAEASWSRVSLEVKLRIFVDVLNGLSALHGHCDEAREPLELRHGAVTPANVLVGFDGTTRLVHLLRPREADAAPSTTTRAYVAPELRDGKQADARADLYSVGVLLWEALCAATPEDEPWASPLAAVTQRAMQADPNARFATAAEMAAEVRKIAKAKLATPAKVAATVREVAGAHIAERRKQLATAPPLRAQIHASPLVEAVVSLAPANGSHPGAPPAPNPELNIPTVPGPFPVPGLPEVPDEAPTEPRKPSPESLRAHAPPAASSSAVFAKPQNAATSPVGPVAKPAPDKTVQAVLAAAPLSAPRTIARPLPAASATPTLATTVAQARPSPVRPATPPVPTAYRMTPPAPEPQPHAAVGVGRDTGNVPSPPAMLAFGTPPPLPAPSGLAPVAPSQAIPTSTSIFSDGHSLLRPKSDGPAEVTAEPEPISLDPDELVPGSRERPTLPPIGPATAPAGASDIGEGRNRRRGIVFGVMGAAVVILFVAMVRALTGGSPDHAEPAAANSRRGAGPAPNAATAPSIAERPRPQPPPPLAPAPETAAPPEAAGNPPTPSATASPPSPPSRPRGSSPPASTAPRPAPTYDPLGI